MNKGMCSTRSFEGQRRREVSEADTGLSTMRKQSDRRHIKLRSSRVAFVYVAVGLAQVCLVPHTLEYRSKPAAVCRILIEVLGCESGYLSSTSTPTERGGIGYLRGSGHVKKSTASCKKQTSDSNSPECKEPECAGVLTNRPPYSENHEGELAQTRVARAH